MKNKKVLLGGEVSGHFYLNIKNKYYFEAPFVIALLIIEHMIKTGKPLSEITKKYQKYAKTEEINFTVKDKDATIKKVENYFCELKIKVTSV